MLRPTIPRHAWRLVAIFHDVEHAGGVHNRHLLNCLFVKPMHLKHRQKTAEHMRIALSPVSTQMCLLTNIPAEHDLIEVALCRQQANVSRANVVGRVTLSFVPGIINADENAFSRYFQQLRCIVSVS